MQRNDLIDLCQTVFRRAKYLVPYSANKPMLVCCEPHKRLAILASRVRKFDIGSVKELIRQMNLPIFNDQAPKHFAAYKVECDGEYHNYSMTELLQYIINNIPMQLYPDRHKDKAEYLPAHCLTNMAKNAIKFGIGNCAELASLVYMLLLEQEIASDINVELMTVPFGPEDAHHFIVVGRDLKGDVNNLKNWGQAIIIDVWDNDIIDVQTGLSLISKNQKRKRFMDCFTHYINKEVEKEIIACGKIGQGLPRRYIEQSKIKKRPLKFSLYRSKYELCKHSFFSEQNETWLAQSTHSSHKIKINQLDVLINNMQLLSEEYRFALLIKNLSLLKNLKINQFSSFLQLINLLPVAKRCSFLAGGIDWLDKILDHSFNKVCDLLCFLPKEDCWEFFNVIYKKNKINKNGLNINEDNVLHLVNMIPKRYHVFLLKKLFQLENVKELLHDMIHEKRDSYYIMLDKLSIAAGDFLKQQSLAKDKQVVNGFCNIL